MIFHISPHKYINADSEGIYGFAVNDVTSYNFMYFLRNGPRLAHKK